MSVCFDLCVYIEVCVCVCLCRNNSVTPTLTPAPFINTTPEHQCSVTLSHQKPELRWSAVYKERNPFSKFIGVSAIGYCLFRYGFWFISMQSMSYVYNYHKEREKNTYSSHRRIGVAFTECVVMKTKCLYEIMHSMKRLGWNYLDEFLLFSRTFHNMRRGKIV